MPMDFCHAISNVPNMDIKQELCEDIGAVRQVDVSMDLQWKNYQDEFTPNLIYIKREVLGEEDCSNPVATEIYQDRSRNVHWQDHKNTATIKKEINVDDNCSNFEENLTSQAATIIFNQQLKCSEKIEEKIILIKHEGFDAGNSPYRDNQTTSTSPKTASICSLYSPESQSTFKILNDGMDVKKESGNNTSEKTKFNHTSDQFIVPQSECNYSDLDQKIPQPTKKVFRCDECNGTFTRSTSLKAHKITHTGKKPFRCDECNGTFTRSSSLKAHKMTHSGEKPHKCDECEYTCTKYSNLKVHKMTHTGEKPYICAHCDYTCTKFINLKVHKLSHTLEKPFKCEECDFTCKRADHLKLHKMRHSGEKPFKCAKCDYTCTNSSNLKVHTMTHSDEKPFKCTECEYTCRRFGNMKVHITTHFGKKRK